MSAHRRRRVRASRPVRCEILAQVARDDFPTNRPRSRRCRRRRAASSCRPARRRGRARLLAPAPESAARGARRRGPGPTSGPRRSPAARRPTSCRAGHGAGERGRHGRRIGLRLGIVGEAEVERRRAWRSARRAASTTSSPQALRQRSSTAAGRCGTSSAGRPRRSSVPNTPWTSRRGPPSTSGSAVEMSGMVGRAERRSSGPARGAARSAPWQSSGRRCRVALSINASRSGRRRSVSPAMARAQRVVGRRQVRAPAVARRFERQALAKHRIEHPQRGAARADARQRLASAVLHCVILASMKRPKHLDAADASQPVAARARAASRRARRAAARAKREAARPDPLRRLGEEGHRRRFLDAPRSLRARRPRQQPPERPRRPTPARRAARRPQRRSACRRRSPRRARASTGAVNAPSATVLRSASSSAGRAALADALAEREIARAGRGAGQDEVAEPGQAGQRLAPGALGEAEAGHFGKAARDQRGAGILAEPAPSTTPQAMASTFLTAPPISAPATSSDR